MSAEVQQQADLGNAIQVLGIGDVLAGDIFPVAAAVEATQLAEFSRCACCNHDVNEWGSHESNRNFLKPSILQ